MITYNWTINRDLSLKANEFSLAVHNMTNVTSSGGWQTYHSNYTFEVLSETTTTVSTGSLTMAPTSTLASHPATSTSDPPKAVDEGISTGAKAGIVIGVSLAAILFALLLVFHRRRKSRATQGKAPDKPASWSRSELECGPSEKNVAEADSNPVAELLQPNIPLPVELPAGRW